MTVEFRMPQLGLTMTEGVVSKWLKSVGDHVAIGDPLVEVETDKITNQIEASAEGVLLAILVPSGGTAPVKAPIALIGQPGETVETAGQSGVDILPAPLAEPAGPPPGGATDVSARAADDGWIKASPIARRLAGEKGIELSRLTGTGPGGRIVERDVLAFAGRSRPRVTPLAAKVAAEHGVDLAAMSSDGRITSREVLAMTAKPAAAAVPADVAGTPLAGMRRVIAERMSASWSAAPHVSMTVETDMSEATNLKQRLSEATGAKVSFTEIVVRCAARALTEFGAVNASLIDGLLYRHADVHIGVAVALDDGLIVPVVRHAAGKSVSRLGAEIRELTEKARQGRLAPDEVTGGTFTVTNLGMYGVDHFTPIINQPESAILGVCRVVERQVVRQGAAGFRPMMNLCLSFDHRVVDGSVAARFLARIRQLLEQPLLLV
jgi:pyruvate dehydrogenase E2 component (dihydrolipoamide acetyltransferase)